MGSVSTIVQVVLIILKLTGLVTYSWWWVMAPTWIGFIVALMVLPFLIYAHVKKNRILRMSRMGRSCL